MIWDRGVYSFQTSLRQSEFLISDLCSYLECEMESSSVQKYLQHLLQSEAVNCGITKHFRLEEIKVKKNLVDPRIIMELRHKQVSKQGSSVKRNKVEDYRIRVNAQWYLLSIPLEPVIISDLETTTQRYSSIVQLKLYCISLCTSTIQQQLAQSAFTKTLQVFTLFLKTDRKSCHSSQFWVCFH